MKIIQFPSRQSQHPSQLSGTIIGVHPIGDNQFKMNIRLDDGSVITEKYRLKDLTK